MSAAQAMHRRAAKQYLMAVSIHAAVVRDSAPRQSPIVPIETMQTVARLERLELVAESRGLNLAAAAIGKRIVSGLRTIRESVNQSLDAICRPGDSAFRYSLSEIIADLTALESEFDDLQFNRKNQTISVTTGPIELEGVALGQFQIVLELRYLGQSQPYRVIAKDPKPAAACDSTTHPHVQSESLCEGEGQQAIKQTLTDGRIYDFFQIVQQILQTYNPHSAYISIKDWFGVECGDCGSSVSEDDSVSCSRCGDCTCNECCCSCEGCDETFCSACTSSCEGCDTHYCSGCMSSCDRCDKPFCQDCLTENMCDDCLDEERETTESKTSSETEPEVHAVCMGETEVST